MFDLDAFKKKNRNEHKVKILVCFGSTKKLNQRENITHQGRPFPSILPAAYQMLP